MVEKSKFKGFTLLELIVAMAIIAVLIGLSLLGIQTVQRSSRDTERRTTLEAINLELTDYYGNKNAYPAAAANMPINRTSSPKTITVGTGGKTVNLNGAATPLAATATDSDSSGSVYCYSGGSSYSLGVKLESGQWFNLGNATTDCSTANL